MSSTGGGIVVRQQTSSTFVHGAKYLTIQNDSASLDLTMTEEQANNLIDAMGCGGGVENAYLVIWGTGT